MSYAFGDVILVPFPFTDRSTTKQRPAVVISSTSYNNQRPDPILLAVTSQVRTPLSFGEALVADWQAAGLIKPSVFKPLVATIEQALVIRPLGLGPLAERERGEAFRENFLHACAA
jgi:mRNA interferase MazF